LRALVSDVTLLNRGVLNHALDCRAEIRLADWILGHHRNWFGLHDNNLWWCWVSTYNICGAIFVDYCHMWRKDILC